MRHKHLTALFKSPPPPAQAEVDSTETTPTVSLDSWSVATRDFYTVGRAGDEDSQAQGGGHEGAATRHPLPGGLQPKRHVAGSGVTPGKPLPT